MLALYTSNYIIKKTERSQHINGRTLNHTDFDCAQKPLQTLRYVDVMRLLFLIAPLALIGMGFGEHQRPNIIKTRV
jgi:hypothetical protein